MSLVIRALVIALLAVRAAAAADWHVAPDGRDDGDGSRDRPWSLPFALRGAPDTPDAASKPRVGPGDTVWLHGGTYRGRFTSAVRGEAGRPVTFRASPGERVTVDSQELFVVEGDWTTLWGFELTCSDPHRVTKIAGSWPEDIRRGGFYTRASHVRFVNLIVHDTSQAFALWSEGEGGEVCGCIAYNNGWSGPDRGHGHALYAQNERGTKRLVDNVFFNQFGYGVHAYGSEKAPVKNFHLEGNVAFMNGAPHGELTTALHVGGGGTADGVTLVRNFTFGGERGGGTVRLGYPWGVRRNGALVLRDNYIVGTLDVLHWQRVECRGNTVVAPSGLAHIVLPAGGDLANYDWDENTFLRTGRQWEAFGLGTGERWKAVQFADWQEAGLDPQGTFRQTAPEENEIFVRPNRDEPGRAHVIVYNWALQPSVSVDLSDILRMGQRYRVVSAQDFFGEPVIEAAFDGRPVRLPMREYRAPAPIGLPDRTPPATGPTFNVFVVLPENES